MVYSLFNNVSFLFKNVSRLLNKVSCLLNKVSCLLNNVSCLSSNMSIQQVIHLTYFPLSFSHIGFISSISEASLFAELLILFI